MKLLSPSRRRARFQGLTGDSPSPIFQATAAVETETHHRVRKFFATCFSRGYNGRGWTSPDVKTTDCPSDLDDS